jgi:hypothetical protein
VVVLGTGLLVLGLDLGELDLHVVVAGSQRGARGSVEGKERARQGDLRREKKEDTYYAEVFFWPPPTFFASVEPKY